MTQFFPQVLHHALPSPSPSRQISPHPPLSYLAVRRPTSVRCPFLRTKMTPSPLLQDAALPPPRGQILGRKSFSSLLIPVRKTFTLSFFFFYLFPTRAKTRPPKDDFRPFSGNNDFSRILSLHGLAFRSKRNPFFPSYIPITPLFQTLGSFRIPPVRREYLSFPPAHEVSLLYTTLPPPPSHLI